MRNIEGAAGLCGTAEWPCRGGQRTLRKISPVTRRREAGRRPESMADRSPSRSPRPYDACARCVAPVAQKIRTLLLRSWRRYDDVHSDGIRGYFGPRSSQTRGMLCACVTNARLLVSVTDTDYQVPRSGEWIRTGGGVCPALAKQRQYASRMR